MQKIFRKNIGIIMTAAIMTILIINFITNVFSLQKQRLNIFNNKIDQIIHTLENNQIELESIRNNLDEDYLTRAKAAAYVVENNPDILKDVSELKNLAGLLDVDEVHIIDENGIIIYSSVPKYIGIDFHDGEQTSGFLPLIEGDEKCTYIVQEAQPNYAEGKIMQYVGVARQDVTGIVQVGLAPVRLIEAQKRNTYDYIFSRFPTEQEEAFFAVDYATDEVIGCSGNLKNMELGDSYCLENLSDCNSGAFKDMGNGYISFVVTRQYGDVLIGAAIPRHVLFKELWNNMLLTCLYLIIIFVIVIGLLNFLIQKNVIKGIHSILDDLTEIANGNLDTTVAVEGNIELEQLGEGINNMVKSIVNSTDRLSRIIDLSDISLAAFEYQTGMQQVFITSGLSELLNLSEYETANLYKDAVMFYNKIEEIIQSPIDGEKNVYKMGENRYVRIHLAKDESGYLGVVTDVSPEILNKQQMLYENNHDQLTGLCRYQYFKQRVKDILMRLPEGEICASVMLDMDNFKSINDTYGHDIGDKYLKTFAGMLLELPEEHCLSARRSGDEFCIFLFGYRRKEEIVALLHSFWRTLEENPMEIQENSYKTIRISGGFSIIAQADTSVKELFHQADEALYEVKNANKGYFVEYHS